MGATISRSFFLLALVVGGILLLAGCMGGMPMNGTSGSGDANGDSGQALYQANCQQCHGDSQGRGRIASAPPHTNEGHTWHHPDQQLEEIILKGSQRVYGRGAMPPFEGKLTREEVRSILAYLKTWWGEEERAFQAEVTENARKTQG